MARIDYNPNEEAAIVRAREVLSRVPDPEVFSPPPYDRLNEQRYKEYASAFMGELVVTPLSFGANKLLAVARRFPLESIYLGAGIFGTWVSYEMVEDVIGNRLIAGAASVVMASSVFLSYREKKEKLRTSTH